MLKVIRGVLIRMSPAVTLTLLLSFQGGFSDHAAVSAPQESKNAPALLRVCTPNADGETFECHDETMPIRIVPIPSQGPILVRDSRNVLG